MWGQDVGSGREVRTWGQDVRRWLRTGHDYSALIQLWFDQGLVRLGFVSHKKIAPVCGKRQSLVTRGLSTSHVASGIKGELPQK